MRRFNDVYDPGALVRNLLWFAGIVVLMRLAGGAGFAVIVPLMLFAIVQNKTEKLLVFMMLMVAVLIGNGNIIPKDFVFAALQKGLMVVMAVMLMTKLAGIRHSRLVTPFMGMFVYIVFMAISSAQGWNPLISYLKLFLFSSCFFAYYSVANTVIVDPRSDVQKIRSVYLSFACFMLIGSVFLIPFPEIANMSSQAVVETINAGANITSLFCGMTFHSQALGPLVAVLFVLILGDMIFSVRKPDKLMIILLCCCPILIYKTSSRTAMGTMLAGGGFLLWQFMLAKHMNTRWRSKVFSVSLLLIVLASALLLCTSSGRQSVTKYMLKSGGYEGQATVSMDELVTTRQGLMDSAMDNFREKPLLGNGFQVSEDLIGAGSGGWRSVLTAPVEKGVWMTAILEEGGVTGFAIFVVFVVVAIVLLRKRGAYISAALLLTIVVLNLGEFTMFSMSGIGGCYWALCFVGTIMDAQRLMQPNMQPSFNPISRRF